jgi:hypothetical protein
MKTRISIDVNDQMSVVELKNADGHTFTFNPNTRQGEELHDFITTCKNHTISEIEEYQKKKIIRTLNDLTKIAKRYEKERQGLYEWELPLLNDVRDLLKYLENGNK